MGWVHVDRRRRAILDMVRQGHGASSIAVHLKIPVAYVGEALAWANTNFRAINHAKRADCTAGLVHRGVPLPVAAFLQSMDMRTARRDVHLAERLTALRRLTNAGDTQDIHWADNFRSPPDPKRLREELALIAVWSPLQSNSHSHLTSSPP